MAEGDKTVHKLDEATRKLLIGLYPFSTDQTSEFNLVNPESETGKKLPEWARAKFRIRPFVKNERNEAFEATKDWDANKAKRIELARKVTKGWSGLFDIATGDEIKFKSNNADGGADETLFSALPESTTGLIFNHAYAISGLSLPERLGLK